MLRCKMVRCTFLRRRFTSLVRAVSITLALVSCSITSSAQPSPAPAPADAVDQHIAQAIKQVSAERIQQTIEKLVTFGNRSTISPQDDESVKAGKGVGAARD